MQKKGTVKFVNSDKNQFYQSVKDNVNNYFTENNISKYGNASMVLKSIILLLVYTGCFAIILLLHPLMGWSLLLWGIMGVTVAGIGMSVMHDANHGAYSKSASVNRWMGRTINMLGGIAFNWKLQHNILHHTYTNIPDMDDDIDEKAGMRFSPHGKLYKVHRIQFVYAFLLYGFITLYWVLAKDFVQFARYSANGVNPDNKQQNTKTLAGIIFVKACYFFIFLITPAVFFHIPFIQVITGFLVMHFIGGMILSVVFQMAHTVEGTTHPIPDENGTIENCWAIHQMNTTVNFARKNKWLSWYVGGLNFQVEHHLFPKICHVHYPNIAPIVKRTAEEHGVPYLDNTTFWMAFHSHLITLRRFGVMADADDLIG